ncbi:MAG: hypothetical protein WKF83_16715 [Nocardioidaceae bacterium]
MTLRRAAVGDSAAIAALEAAALGVDAWSEGTVRAELVRRLHHSGSAGG